MTPLTRAHDHARMHAPAGNHGKKIAVIENEFGEVSSSSPAPAHRQQLGLKSTNLTTVTKCPPPPHHHHTHAECAGCSSVCVSCLLLQVGIDDALVMETKEEIFELNNGCVCCTGVCAGHPQL